MDIGPPYGTLPPTIPFTTRPRIKPPVRYPDGSLIRFPTHAPTRIAAIIMIFPFMASFCIVLFYFSDGINDGSVAVFHNSDDFVREGNFVGDAGDTFDFRLELTDILYGEASIL